LTFEGTPGFGYRLWTSTNPAWRPVTATCSNLANGTFSDIGVTFTDTQTTNLARRFYLIAVP
jgi:hypothetical protein